MSSVVYFLESGGSIKIGRTADLATRMGSLRSSSAIDVRLIGAVLGGKRLEKAIHEELVSFAERGEWFRDDPIVRRIIDRVLRGGIRGEAAAALTAKDACPAILKKVDELALVTEAQQIINEGIRLYHQHREGTGTTIARLADAIGVPTGTVWQLRYRPPQSLTAGAYLAIQRFARELAQQRDAA
jgi:hypothetical protein